LMLLIGAGMGLVYVRRRARAQSDGVGDPGLDADEQARLDQILKG